MKKVLLSLVLLVVLAVAGLMVYVTSIDWNQHKDKIAAQFLDLTGKKIVFGGEVSLQFLPSPNLKASDVKIYNQNSNEPLVEVKSLVANLALSPLLQGSIDVKRMVLVDPQIYVLVNEDGTLNWQQEMTAEQRSSVELAEITLNSVSLENATVNFEMPSQNISRQLDKLNGEIMAQSIMGPYRIEGNYVSDKTPEGFAISVGKLSDSFSTTLNLVFTHPTSESYLRFDGSFMLGNKVLNGNMIVESKKLYDFVKANFKKIEMPEAYDYPLAVTLDVSANEQQVNLSNMVIKYGDTQGAGSVQIPLNDGLLNDDDSIKPRIDMAFNFTDFNLDPMAYTVKEFVSKYKNQTNIYEPDFPFDMLVDIKSLKTTYNGQPIKNFETSFDIINNMVTVNNFTATLPGETDVKFKGDLSTYENEPFYNLDMSFNASDFLKTLNWLGIEPQVSVASTYRKAMGNAKLSGTFNRIQISPFALTIDKSSLSGEAGIRLGKRPDVMIVLNADSVNFDNYIVALPVEQQNQNWSQRMQYRFAKLGNVNDFDLQLNAKFDLAIYENMPFEKVEVKVNLLDGRMDVSQLRINSVANAQWEFSGILKGFGGVPVFENLKYAVKTKDVGALINKLEFKAPNLDYKKLRNFEAKGIATGSMERFAMKMISKLESFDLAYAGQVNKQNGEYSYNGMLEVKHPDFVKMINELDMVYNPQTYSLGLFNLKAKLIGDAQQFKANPLDFNIGFNSFSGDLTYDNTAEKPNILTSLYANKLEIERFMSQGSTEGNAAQPTIQSNGGGEVEFLAKPFWDKARFDLKGFKKFNLSGRFNIKDISYKKYALQNAVVEMSLSDGVLDLSNLTGNYKNTPFSARMTLNTNEKTSLSGSMKLEGIDVDELGLGGSRYGISGGKTNLNLVANATPISWDEMANTLSGTLEVSISNPIIKGWDLATIYSDIIERQVPDGLSALVQKSLQGGSTEFNSLSAKLNLVDGAFTLSDAAIIGSGMTIGMYGDGNIRSWDMNLLFNVKYEEPRWLPGYSFSLKGPMTAPLVDVDVSALFNLYKSRIDKVSAETKAEADAEQNRLKSLVTDQQKAAEVLRNEVKNVLLPEVESQLKVAQSNQAIAGLQQAQNLLSEQGAEIAKNANLGMSVEVGDALIAEMAAANQQVTAELEKIKAMVAEASLLDQKFVMKNTYEQLVETYNQGKLLVFNYNSVRDEYKSRLAKIETNYKFDEDANVLGWQQFMDDKAALMNNQNQPLMSKYMPMQKSTDMKELREYNTQLHDLLSRVQEDVAAMTDSSRQFKEYAEVKVKQAEDDYTNKLRDEEVQRKLKENVGSISIKKTGKSVKVQRDIEEIEKSEELTAHEKVKVLDFSKPMINKPSTSQTDEASIKKGRVIRK